MMAQKMFQAAAMSNFAGNKRMGGPPQHQMNFANDDFDGSYTNGPESLVFRSKLFFHSVQLRFRQFWK